MNEETTIVQKETVTTGAQPDSSVGGVSIRAWLYCGQKVNKP